MNNKVQILDFLKSNKQLLLDKYNVAKIGLFGSYASDTATKDSDVDICIKTNSTDLFVLVHLKEYLKELFKTDVDIVRIRDKMNPYLKNRIEKEAIYVCQTLIIEIVSQIISAIETVEERFKVVNNVNDFTDSPSGMEKLDSICMLLIGKVQKV